MQTAYFILAFVRNFVAVFDDFVEWPTFRDELRRIAQRLAEADATDLPDLLLELRELGQRNITTKIIFDEIERNSHATAGIVNAHNPGEPEVDPIQAVREAGIHLLVLLSRGAQPPSGQTPSFRPHGEIATVSVKERGSFSIADDMCYLEAADENTDMPSELDADAAEPLVAKSPVESAQPAQSASASEPSASLEPSAPLPRYADITFYSEEEDYSEKEDDTKLRRLADGYVLRKDQWYVLEVAVRARITGIPVVEQERTPILDSQQEKTVEILVTVEPDGFEVEEQVQTLLLPPTGDSMQNARFRVRPLTVTANTANLAAMRIRLYYQFNLLEVGVVQAEVVGKFQAEARSALGLAKPIFWQQQRLEQSYLDFDNIVPRAMHIDITQENGAYLLRFTLRNTVGTKLTLTGASRLIPADLESELNTLRDIWEDIAMSEVFTRQLQGAEEDLLLNVRELARVGSSLWVKLFQQDAQGSMAVIGKQLQQHPLAPNSIVQISVDGSAADFVFPWTILYDRALPAKNYELPDLDGFWGMRYCVEQQIPGTFRSADLPVAASTPLKIAFMGWKQFRNFNLEAELMRSFVQQSAGRLDVSAPPITDAAACYDVLKAGASQIFYFYSHGYTRRLKGNFQNGPDLERFVRRYEGLPADSTLRQDWQYLFDSVKQPGFSVQRSFIELTTGKLYLDDLYREVQKLESHPLVILNMCQSAQVSPALQDSFIHFFLNRGARAVLGTECPMTIEFAHPFAARFLRDVLAGARVGEALVNARRAFMRQNNPLGLAYTLYGSSTLSYQPSCIQNMQEDASTGAVVLAEGGPAHSAG